MVAFDSDSSVKRWEHKEWKEVLAEISLNPMYFVLENVNPNQKYVNGALERMEDQDLDKMRVEQDINKRVGSKLPSSRSSRSSRSSSRSQDRQGSVSPGIPPSPPITPSPPLTRPPSPPSTESGGDSEDEGVAIGNFDNKGLGSSPIPIEGFDTSYIQRRGEIGAMGHSMCNVLQCDAVSNLGHETEQEQRRSFEIIRQNVMDRVAEAKRLMTESLNESMKPYLQLKERATKHLLSLYGHLCARPEIARKLIFCAKGDE